MSFCLENCSRIYIGLNCSRIACDFCLIGFSSTSFTQKEFSETEEAEVDSICAFPKMEMEEEMFRRFDPQRWGEVVGHYILGLLILVATSLLVMAVMHWLVERFRTRATNQEEEEALDKKREVKSLHCSLMVLSVQCD